MPFLGLDIGGAHLKISDGRKTSLSVPFPIWQTPQRLIAELQQLLQPFPDDTGLAVTMTAELADCFATKAAGVEFILQAVCEVAGRREVAVWQSGGEFVTPAEALDLVPLVAAANWHALATWVARLTLDGAGGSAILLDFGSTTCDIIPLSEGVPIPRGRTDPERLISGELVYTGVRRTPVPAVSHTVPFRGEPCVPIAAELFSTMQDVYLLTGELAEDLSDCQTANGGPATIEGAWDRLARQLCCDRTECSREEAVAIATFLRDRQQARIAQAFNQVASRLPEPLTSLVLSGEGEGILCGLLTLPAVRESLAGLATGACEGTAPQILSLRQVLGESHSRAACAYALARLAEERLAPQVPRTAGERRSNIHAS